MVLMGTLSQVYSSLKLVGAVRLRRSKPFPAPCILGPDGRRVGVRSGDTSEATDVINLVGYRRKRRLTAAFLAGSFPRRVGENDQIPTARLIALSGRRIETEGACRFLIRYSARQPKL